MTASASSMSLETAIKERRSVRGFLDQPVPQAVLESVFSLAQHAPSNCNIQPWKVWIASGALKNHLREQLVEKVVSGVPFNADYEYPGKFDGDYRRRQVECAVELYSNMGIARDDKEGRMRASLRNFELFDAPHVCFIGMDKRFGASVALDVGMYVQNLILAMTAHGVASCAQGALRYYPDLVRETFEIGDDINILLGISFGYEDTDVPANKTRVGRDEFRQSVVFSS
ncbi:oxidoreductase [Microbulbifer flavimaris]|uniref:Oxidoreductase n=2 Tax=Microbulbiferaceae TaxID=1706373 RepID=A0ABX4I3R1_9GAMM|nr:oxidoreductase [Microbulbifer sp. ZGT114]PCO07064.1 oxidoreductase [Microbulbifer flavimaris]